MLTLGAFGSPFQGDYKKGIKLAAAKDLSKTPSGNEIRSAKEKVKALKGAYNEAQANGYNASYTSYVKKMGLVEKPSFTFPGFGKGINILEGFIEPGLIDAKFSLLIY